MCKALLKSTSAQSTHFWPCCPWLTLLHPHWPPTHQRGFLGCLILPGTLSPETAPLRPPPGRQAAKSHFLAKSSRSSWHQVCTLLQPSTPITVSETWHCYRLIHPNRCLLSIGSVHTLCWMLRHLCRSHCPPRSSSPSWFRLWPKELWAIRGILNALGQCLERGLERYPHCQSHPPPAQLL